MLFLSLSAGANIGCSWNLYPENQERIPWAKTVGQQTEKGQNCRHELHIQKQNQIAVKANGGFKV